MIKRVITKSEITDSSTRRDLSYWLGRVPEERISAVEILRRQVYGNSARLQRFAQVLQRTRG